MLNIFIPCLKGKSQGYPIGHYYYNSLANILIRYKKFNALSN